jgi:hypothetical protein
VPCAKQSLLGLHGDGVGLVAGGGYGGGFEHEDDGAGGSAGSVEGAAGDEQALVWLQGDGAAWGGSAAVFRKQRGLTALGCKVEEQFAFDDLEVLIFAVMLVPVELAFEDAETDDAVVDARKGLVPPLAWGVFGEQAGIDGGERREGDVGVDVVGSGHGGVYLFEEIGPIGEAGVGAGRCPECGSENKE